MTMQTVGNQSAASAQIKTVDKLVEGINSMAAQGERLVSRLISLRDRLVGPVPTQVASGKKDQACFGGYLGACDEHGTRLRESQQDAHHILDEIEKHI